jgi:hypothetical protein
VALPNGTVLKMATLDTPQRAVRPGDGVALAYDPARLTVLA